ncbi:hypothetical protein [Mesorhizobium sp.]|uniref:hypothetical protein n=1 Tax=Mesorhizobium sp. TaxID=1871066 RepID=UPI000FE47E2D|nr:hypothetical protein [Mesorhizobium sp.]RWP64864.1 MAG: hypothetical protein EOR08_08085 [Mesorhizobium sp.]RWQ56516.1 MAG: hypothetical protein EOS82_03195 [Mesorhizobium sp.]
MTYEEAEKIVGAINYRAFFAMGLAEPSKVVSLEGVSLAQMIEATAVVKAENRRAEAHAKEHGGGYTSCVIPADRLMAAAYVLENYDPDGEAIVMSPYRGWRGNVRALGVTTLTISPETAEAEVEAR